MKKQFRKLTIVGSIAIVLVFALLMGGAATPKQDSNGADPGNGPYKELDWDREDVQIFPESLLPVPCCEEPVTPEPVVKLTEHATPTDLLLEAEDGCSIYRADGSLKENLE